MQTRLIPTLKTEFNFAGFAWPRYVATLPRGNMVRRLAERKPVRTGDYYHAPKPNQTRTGGGSYYHESDFMPSLRWAWCDKVSGVRITHDGWFTSSDGYGDTVRGVVFRLPNNRGFLAACTMGEGMIGEYSRYIHEEETDAAHAADDMAQEFAERMIEDEEEDEE